MNQKTIDRILDYALCYLNANWDDFIEDDLGITQEKFNQFIQKFQNEKLEFDKVEKSI